MPLPVRGRVLGIKLLRRGGGGPSPWLRLMWSAEALMEPIVRICAKVSDALLLVVAKVVGSSPTGLACLSVVLEMMDGSSGTMDIIGSLTL